MSQQLAINRPRRQRPLGEALGMAFGGDFLKDGGDRLRSCVLDPLFVAILQWVHLRRAPLLRPDRHPCSVRVELPGQHLFLDFSDVLEDALGLLVLTRARNSGGEMSVFLPLSEDCFAVRHPAASMKSSAIESSWKRPTPAT